MSGRILTCVLLAAFALATGAWAAEHRVSGTLNLAASLRVTDSSVSCPAGSPAGATCFRFTGATVIRGLGDVTESYTRMLEADDPMCVHTLPQAIIDVPGKGEIDATIAIPECVGRPPVRLAFRLDISGGSGVFAGASGTVDVTSEVSTGSTHRDNWSGTLSVPGLEFDLTPPRLKGAVSKTVRAPRRAKRVRVRYRVRAEDLVDGRVPVTCVPRSGAFFRLGRTRVNCKATDSSANTGKARFTITVKHRRVHKS